MPKQSIIWTVLPNGISADGKSLRLSLLASPRLDPDGQPRVLESFGDFLTWPTTLRNSKFTLHVGSNSGTIVLDASNVDASIGTPDDATWTALFTKQTSVHGARIIDRSKHTVVSYDTVGMHKTVAQVYEKLTLQPGPELPQMDELHELLRPIIESVAKFDGNYFQKEEKGLDRKRMFEDYKKNAMQQADTAQLGFGVFQLFHTPPNEVLSKSYAPKYDPRLTAKYLTGVSAKPELEKAVSAIDFHQVVAAMNQYPTLLRKLGLVLDFVVPRDKVPKSPDFTMWMTVDLPTVPPPKDKEKDKDRVVLRRSANPVTHSKHNDSVFAAVSKPTVGSADLQITDGMLKLAGRFSLLQADVDGAGQKLINFARTLARSARPDRQIDPITKLPRRAGAPALRNSGLMLVHSGRGQSLTDSFTRSKELDDNINKMFDKKVTPASQLYAEDVLRGWRIDIWDKISGKWRSLCERVADYDINKGGMLLSGLREEGMIRLAATSSTDGSNADVVWLHEAVTVWNGWSLVAQQPGKVIDRNDENLRDGSADLPDGIRLKTKFIPRPGSLPRLRYGHVYALRARAVDLAGNSLAPKSANYPGDEKLITDATPYFRFEPVQPPSLALIGTKTGAQLPLAGESMARAVVRSFNDVFNDPAKSTQEAQRWAVSARTSQREAELHGVFDGPAWGTQAQYDLLSARDNELEQFDVVPNVESLLSGVVAGGSGGSKPTIGKTPDQTVSKKDPDDEVRNTSYAVLPPGTQLLPYLPDPLCKKVLVRFLNHPLLSEHEPIVVPLYRKDRQWPDVSPVLVRVYEADGERPRFDVEAHTLLVPTPKATRATLRISPMLDDESLKLMGVWNWIRESSRDAVLKRRAQTGQLWSLTPARELEVVHAVQRPLLKPDIAAMTLFKQSGATWVRPTVMAACHVNSTVKVDLHAVWNEPRDTGIVPPTNNAKDAVPFSIKITDPQGYAGIVEHIVPDDENTNVIAFGDVKSKKNELVAPKIHDFGDTKYRRVEYQLIGTSRFREYMPSDVLFEGTPPTRKATDAKVKLDGAPTVQWVLNSASPAAPEVLYVVPTFGWTRGVDSEGKTASWRQGGGLRVWLDRPWNTTGYGEMLAVCIPKKNSIIEPNLPPYKHTVTQWGNDPIWHSPFVNGVAPLEADFPLRRMAPNISGSWLPPGAPLKETDQPHNAFVTTSLRHPGVPEDANTGAVDVVPHDVYWDDERGLWYCDIEMNHGASYFPFVRLALARYQPSSLSKCYLSNIVLADFCALAPNRWLTVAGSNPTHRSVKVFGSSPEFSSAYMEALPFAQNGANGPVMPGNLHKSTVIEVWVEKLNPAQGEDFGWHKVSTGTESVWQATDTGVTAATTPKKGTFVATNTSTTKATDAKNPVKPAAGTPVTKPKASDTQPVNRSGATPQQKARADQLMSERNFEAVLKESLIDATIEWPTLWSGSIELPTAPSAEARYRVVVAEYEEYFGDGADPYNMPLGTVQRRMVFVEHVEIV